MVKLTPEPESKVEERPDDLSDHAHRQLIGYVGLVLPFALIAIALARDGVERWKALTSISAYYYTGGVSAFVGMLVSLSLFLFTYRGYKNEYQWVDRAAAVTAATAALGVAFFPTVALAGGSIARFGRSAFSALAGALMAAAVSARDPVFETAA
jgi:hypothetical protein